MSMIFQKDGTRGRGHGGKACRGFCMAGCHVPRSQMAKKRDCNSSGESVMVPTRMFYSFPAMDWCINGA